RLRAHEAGGRAVDRLVAGAALVAARRGRLGRDRDRRRRLARADVDRNRARARIRRAPARRGGTPLLLLARARDRLVLDRDDVVPLRALRGDLSGRSLADRRLSRLAALLDDVSRADRLRRHRAGAGADRPPRLADRARAARLRRRRRRVHALVLALRLEALLRSICLSDRNLV